MKFSTILTSTFFALFILTGTTAFAVDNTTTTKESKELIDKEDIDSIIHIIGRTAEVSDNDILARASSSHIDVKVMKGRIMVAQASADSNFVSLDLSELEAGAYIFEVTTLTGTERKVVLLN